MPSRGAEGRRGGSGGLRFRFELVAVLLDEVQVIVLPGVEVLLVEVRYTPTSERNTPSLPHSHLMPSRQTLKFHSRPSRLSMWTRPLVVSRAKKKVPWTIARRRSLALPLTSMNTS